MIVLIDNYDSFSYNVYQLIGSVEPDIKVVRNDEVTIEELEAMKPEALILSPGPGRPEDAGICIESIKYFKDKLPILGICLGHQSICEAVMIAGVLMAVKYLAGGSRLLNLAVITYMSSPATFSMQTFLRKKESSAYASTTNSLYCVVSILVYITLAVAG